MKARNRKSLRGLMVTGLLAAILFLNGCSYEELACEVRDYLQLNNEEQVLLKDEDSGTVSARELEDVEQAPAEAVDGLKEEQTQAFHYNRLFGTGAEALWRDSVYSAGTFRGYTDFHD